MKEKNWVDEGTQPGSGRGQNLRWALENKPLSRGGGWSVWLKGGGGWRRLEGGNKFGGAEARGFMSHPASEAPLFDFPL